MSRFYFGSEDSSDLSDDEDNLPYPTPLPRSSFLDPDFSPTTYLSTLHNRHQTLEDLRSELRSRSQLLSTELLNLVNTNYQDFLGLGGSLKGGEEKVEEVRVGLLGFRREVEGVRKKVVERGQEVENLVTQKAMIRKQVKVGKLLLDIEERLGELEERLMVSPSPHSRAEVQETEAPLLSDSEDEDDSEEGASAGNGNSMVSTQRLQRLVHQYLYINNLVVQTGPEHPFLVAQQHRLTRVRNTMLIDLSTALKQIKAEGSEGKERMINVLSIYREMGETQEALKVIRE
ncbi:MAG: hypothetical protein M1835_002182 [Candelina submexicana]|nr:MAG: hypothetical protein M1835_002182 [Candelina submexicana]